MTTDRTQLRALATAATPGPWEYIPTAPNRGVDFVRTELGPTVCDFGGYPPTRADAAFIAAANPTAVLALLDELRECEDAYEAVNQSLADARQQLATMTAARDEACGLAMHYLTSDVYYTDDLRERIEKLRKIGSQP